MRHARLPRHAVLLLTLLPAACATMPLRTDTYYGSLTPRAGTCETPRPASLTVRGDKVQFAPTQGTVLLTGSLAADGTIAASLQLIDMNRKPARYTLAGHLAGDSIDGVYVTPRCRATISLRRQ